MAQQQYVTKEVLRKELSVTERRLDSKIDAAVQSMKEYTDSRFTHLDTKIDGVEHRLDGKINALQRSIHLLGDKLDTSVKGIVQLIERSIGKYSEVDQRLDNHERRITALEH